MDLQDKCSGLLSELYFGLELPFRDDKGVTIKVGDFLNISFGTGVNKSKHVNVQVYFDIKTLQICVRGGNITSSAFPVSLVGYVNPEYEILDNNA